MREYRLGDKVDILKSSMYEHQSEGNLGRVVRVPADRNRYHIINHEGCSYRSHGETWVRVRWENTDTEDMYPYEDLLLVNGEGDDVDDVDIGQFLIPGQVVRVGESILAVVVPTSTEVDRIFAYRGGLDEILEGRYGNFKAIKLTNGKEYTVSLSDISEVTEGFVDLTVYQYSERYVIKLSTAKGPTSGFNPIKYKGNIQYIGEITAEMGVQMLQNLNK